MSERQVSVSKFISHPPEKIFDLLSSPAGHAKIDGSGSVKGAVKGPERLGLGSKFRMDMKIGVPYKMSSVVKEFDDNKLIAWAHFGGHRWRYELEPADGGTNVTETFDWSYALVPKAIELGGYPKKHPANMERTLDRIAEILDSEV